MEFQHNTQNDDIQLEIDTLFHKGLYSNFEKASVEPVHFVAGTIPDSPNSNPEETESDHPFNFTATKTCLFEEFPRTRHVSKRSNKPVTVTVDGRDLGDFPTQYTVKDLRPYEAPVIGTYVGKSIAPGFKYRVRILGSHQYVFNGHPRFLQSIGMGYGRRITFEGDCLNSNFNYFYSDTRPQGYGFEIVALETGYRFGIQNEQGFTIGDGIVTEVISQKEIQSIQEGTTLQKCIGVVFTCDVTYGSTHQGLVPLRTEDSLQLSGIAKVEKSNGQRKAVTRVIEPLELPCYGQCTLHFAK